MAQIVSIHRKDKEIDVEREFKTYKYAIPEHEPVKLSTGMYLHTYKLTKYGTNPCFEDEDVENDAFKREMCG